MSNNKKEGGRQAQSAPTWASEPGSSERPTSSSAKATTAMGDGSVPGPNMAGTGTAQVSGGAAGTDSSPRSVVACSKCREQKIKCFPSEEGGDAKCKRCEKYNLKCEYLMHKRGRKKRVSNDEAPPSARSTARFAPQQTSPNKTPRTHVSSAQSSVEPAAPSSHSRIPAPLPPAYSISSGVMDPPRGLYSPSYTRPSTMSSSLTSRPTSASFPSIRQIDYADRSPYSAQGQGQPSGFVDQSLPPLHIASDNIVQGHAQLHADPMVKGEPMVKSSPFVRREPLVAEPISYLHRTSAGSATAIPMEGGRGSSDLFRGDVGMSEAASVLAGGFGAQGDFVVHSAGSDMPNFPPAVHGSSMSYSNIGGFGPDFNMLDQSGRDQTQVQRRFDSENSVASPIMPFGKNGAGRPSSMGGIGQEMSGVQQPRPLPMIDTHMAGQYANAGRPAVSSAGPQMTHFNPSVGSQATAAFPSRMEEGRAESEPKPSSIDLSFSTAPSYYHQNVQPLQQQPDTAVTGSSSRGIASAELGPRKSSSNSGGTGKTSGKGSSSNRDFLPPSASKFPFLNANAESSYSSLDPSADSKSTPTVVPPHGPLAPVERGTARQSQSSHPSARQGASIERFSLRHMVEPMDDSGDEDDSASLPDKEDSPEQGPAVRRDEQTGQASRKRRRLTEGEDVRGSPALGQDDDPITRGILTENQAKELFAIFMVDINSACPMLDPALHTFDFVRARSPLLLSAIMCVTTRFYRGGTETRTDMHQPIPPSLAKAAHHRCLLLAREHVNFAFQEAISTVEVVQAMVLLAVWKEIDDDKPYFYFHRAVCLAQEIKLGKLETFPLTDPIDIAWRRARERMWLCLFVVSTIFAMQFSQHLMIPADDPVVARSASWLQSNPSATDVHLVASVQMRIRFWEFKNLLRTIAVDEDQLVQPGRSYIPNVLSLTVLTKTITQSLRIQLDYWTEQITKVTGTAPSGKIKVYYYAFLLHLNVVIHAELTRLNNSLPEADRYEPWQTTAYHNAIDASCNLLHHFTLLRPRQTTFASDTLLHFTMYAGYCLYAICPKSAAHPLEASERERCWNIINATADSLAEASLYPFDSPAYHARFLRNLVYTNKKSWRLEVDPSTNISDDVPMSSTSSQIPIAPTDADSGGPAVRPGELPVTDVPPYGSGQFGHYPQTMVPETLMDIPAPAASLFSGGEEAIFAELGGAWWNHIFNDNDVSLRENYFAPRQTQL